MKHCLMNNDENKTENRKTIKVKTKTIVANWKMHHGPSETREFLGKFLPLLSERDLPRILLFPPAISLEVMSANIGKHTDIGLGIQNIYWELEGAFTGEHSAAMAVSVGAEFALIGHSERRHLFGESDHQVKNKVSTSITAGLKPVVCVGETKIERVRGDTETIITQQLDSILSEISDQKSGSILFAYEPVWAIGTGMLPEPDEIEEAHSLIRMWMKEKIGEAFSSSIPILYGGSVNENNAKDLLKLSNVDGLLVGGASLDPMSFSKIIESASL